MQMGSGQPGAYARAGRVQVAFNTLVNNRDTVRGEHRTEGPRDLVFANNLLMSNTGTLFQFGDPQTNPFFEGNILWGNARPGSIPDGGYTFVNPRLARDSSGLLRLTPASPAINASVGFYSYVLDDMDGQPRDELPDVGADEFSDAPITSGPLAPADVGPFAP